VDDSAPRELLVESVRFHKKYVLLKVENVDTRDDVESLRGHWVLVPEEEAISLEEGEVFFFELEGLAVHTEEGEHLGRLVEVLETGANEVFVVRGERGEVLLPNTEEVILEVDIDAGKMVVRLLPGLLT
jgi:16S rRNA processing protein RimM